MRQEIEFCTTKDGDKGRDFVLDKNKKCRFTKQYFP